MLGNGWIFLVYACLEIVMLSGDFLSLALTAEKADTQRERERVTHCLERSRLLLPVVTTYISIRSKMVTVMGVKQLVT